MSQIKLWIPMIMLSTLNNLFSFLAIVIATGLVLGCAQTPVRTVNACAGIDWFEIGRTDGITGAPLSRLEELQSRCDHTSDPVDADLYMNGRNAGLIDYCTAQMGMEMGRTGSIYEGVCPDHLERPFLINYNLGRRIRQLELENYDLESRIDSLVRRISSENPGESVKKQLEELRRRRSQNRSRIPSLLETSHSQERDTSAPSVERN